MTTVSDSALRPPHSTETTPVQAKQDPDTPHSALTDSDNETWLVRAWRAATAWSVPPQIWSDQRPALRDLWAYATRAPWTTPVGFWRRFGQGYALLVALPTACAAYWLAWIAERPTRLLAFLLLAFVLGHR